MDWGGGKGIFGYPMRKSAENEGGIRFTLTAVKDKNENVSFCSTKQLNTVIYIYKNLTVRLCVVFKDVKLRK
jgi:hypothetical protein